MPNDFSEDALIEQPAIQLMESLGWKSVNCFAETFGNAMPHRTQLGAADRFQVPQSGQNMQNGGFGPRTGDERNRTRATVRSAGG